MMIWYMYTLWKYSSKKNQCIHYIIYLPSVCVCVKTFKLFRLRKFQFYSTVSFTVITMLYIRFSDLIHFILENWYPFTNLFLPAPKPWQPLFALFLWVWPLNYRYKHSYRYIPFISDIMQYESFSAWPISLSLQGPHVVASGNISFSSHDWIK